MSATLINKTLQLIKEQNVKFVDLRFCDTRGKEQHVSVPVDMVDANFLKEGKTFDGSSIAGWKNISSSDMILMPDMQQLILDPFFDDTTLILRCDVIEPATLKDYERCPRAVARRAEAYLSASKIADICNIGPEPEFFIFDKVLSNVSMQEVSYRIDCEEGAWNSKTDFEAGNTGHRPRIKGGYFPVPPVDSSQDIRSAMCLTLKDMGFQPETHHHEVASANQNEINCRFSSLLTKADEMLMLKYVVQNVAHAYGKTATFMPKPLMGDNGNGMHCHLSLAKAGKNLFTGKSYAGLSELALHFIGGIIKHARAINAFTNPGTNSYKRLVPGFEAPVLLAYSSCNRSAAIRVPFVANPTGRRIEIRFPDPMANPYLAFSALLMAGLDGIKRKIDPGAPTDKDLYDLSATELRHLPTVCSSLEQALDHLRAHGKFLLEGGVFNQDLIDGYIELKMAEVDYLRTTPHPVEFEMYYSA